MRHEAADAESAPMPLAMPCLVPPHGGGSVARHEHRAKGRLSNSSEPPYLTLDKDRREKVVKVASLSTHLVGGPTWVFTSVGGSWSARQGR